MGMESSGKERRERAVIVNVVLLSLLGSLFDETSILRI
jgi:hypothetical protein